MGWQLSDDEMTRVMGLDVEKRLAYAIDKISEQSELWTLESAKGGWVISTHPDGVLSIPVWPHERFARAEASGAWADAEPFRIYAYGDWLTEDRAAWFAEKELVVSVFLVGGSATVTEYARLAELIRERPQERRRSSGVAREPKRATKPTSDLVTYVNDREIDRVIERVPAEHRTRLRGVFRHRRSDAKVLGGVSDRGRREIDLNARLPVRVSLGRYLYSGQTAAEFGAPEVGQWPPWAVRRFLLYDVLLHEIGHLQVVEPRAANANRKFASETRAEEFADELRRTLYSERYEHADPIHNAPTPAELSMLTVWNRLDKAQRARLVALVLSRRPDDAALATFEPMTEPWTIEQRAFLARVVESRE